MAQGKKSFLLYADYIDVFEELSDIDAGQLVKHLLRYVNDKNPETDNPFVKIGFAIIRNQLKRDLKVWESEREKRAISGKIGGIKSGESRRTKQDEANRSSASKNEANEAVTATVNVTATATIDREKVLEYLRGAAPIGTERSTLEAEADLLMKTYSGKKIGNLRALCNKWMANFAERPTMPQPPKKMVL